jgi:hypothetical protein
MAESNRFLPLQNDDDDEAAPDNLAEEDGWPDDPSLGSSTASPVQGISSHCRRRKQEKVRKKTRTLKVKCPRKSTPPPLTGPEWCLKEAKKLGLTKTLTSLQSAAISIGFPAKTFNSNNFRQVGLPQDDLPSSSPLCASCTPTTQSQTVQPSRENPGVPPNTSSPVPHNR